MIYDIIENLAEANIKFRINTGMDLYNKSARTIIDNHYWGTYGKEGKDPYKEVLLVECETEHLINILRTQPQISSLTTMVIVAILRERGEI